MANGWPLTLQQAQQLSQYFNRDIRKAILHLQLMLSWQPSDPLTLPPVGDLDAVPKSLGTINQYYPWRTQCYTCLSSKNGSSLFNISPLSDWKSEVDSIHHWQRLQPWTVRLEASLEDELPINSYTNPLAEDLVNILSLPATSTAENVNMKWCVIVSSDVLMMSDYF